MKSGEMLSRMLIGIRISLSVGAISVLISLLIGISLGALAGFYRGWVDNLIMWIIKLQHLKNVTALLNTINLNLMPSGLPR